MKSRILFLTRSWFPNETGGTLIRKAQVAELRLQGFEVLVITPGNSLSDDSKNGILRVPYPLGQVYFPRLEQIGILQDYLWPWAQRVLKIVLPTVKKNDILFATSGGEMGMVLLGCAIKKIKNIPLVLNLHDPFDHTSVNGYMLRKRNFFLSHVRDKLEKKCLFHCDAIITSCRTLKEALIIKYPQLHDHIINSSFGWIESNEPILRKKKELPLCIVYGGSMSKAQSPEILSNIVQGKSNVKAHFFGPWQSYPPLMKFKKGITLHENMSYTKYISWMQTYADVGFVSLGDDYFGACFPSKIFEYLNIGIPILGALPKGEARDTINSNGYGIALDFRDLDGLRQAINSFQNQQFYEQCKKNLIRDKNKWSIRSHGEELCRILNNIDFKKECP